LPTLVDSPTLTSVDPAPHKILIFWGYEIIEWTAHNCGGGEDAIVRAILDDAVFSEAVQDEERPRRLGVKLGITRGSIGK
jgi:hypothetical protein